LGLKTLLFFKEILCIFVQIYRLPNHPMYRTHWSCCVCLKPLSDPTCPSASNQRHKTMWRYARCRCGVTGTTPRFVSGRVVLGNSTQAQSPMHWTRWQQRSSLQKCCNVRSRCTNFPLPQTPPPLLLIFLISDHRFRPIPPPPSPPQIKGMSAAFTCSLQSKKNRWRKTSEEECPRINAVVAALEILRHCFCVRASRPEQYGAPGRHFEFHKCPGDASE